jgi:hypothetical protein
VTFVQDFDFDCSQNSGSLLRVSKKLQINIEMQELVGVEYFKNVTHFLWPAFYVDEVNCEFLEMLIWNLEFEF